MMFIFAISTIYQLKTMLQLRREMTNNDKYRTGLVFMEKNKDGEEL